MRHPPTSLVTQLRVCGKPLPSMCRGQRALMTSNTTGTAPHALPSMCRGQRALMTRNTTGTAPHALPSVCRGQRALMTSNTTGTAPHAPPSMCRGQRALMTSNTTGTAPHAPPSPPSRPQEKRWQLRREEAGRGKRKAVLQDDSRQTAAQAAGSNRQTAPRVTSNRGRCRQ